VCEGWETGGRGARILRELPSERDGSGEGTEVWLALVGDCRGVSVLMAHHRDSITVCGHLSVKLVVAVLEALHSFVECVKFIIVGSHEATDFAIELGVDVNVAVTASELSESRIETGTQTSDLHAKCLSSDQHVSGLCCLKLVAVLTEQSTFGVEVVNGHLELGDGRISRRCGVTSTEVVMVGIDVVVVGVQFHVIANNAFDGCSSSSGNKE